MEDLLIEVLALDCLIKTYRRQLTQEDFVLETQEDKMAFYDVHDRAVYLLKMKLQQLPEPVQQEIFSILWINQTSEPTS
mgnify:CR=1 FL=1|jgi:hypothetical protein